MPLDPARTVRELEELRELTGDENGAQRVAWTETWERGARVAAREGRADRRRATSSTRRATSGSRCRGRSERALLIGGHMDSVPNGGWLDGCLNVLAGVEVLRRIAEEGEPPVTVRLVDWADEEGARFGRSLFGSSAAAGSMRDQDELAKLDRPRRRRAARRRSRAHGVELDRALEARVAARRTRRPTSSCTSSRARCSSRWTCRSASSSAPSASSARASRGAARPRTRARRRWTSAATRSPARRSSRSTSARSRPRSATARCAPRAASSAGRGSSPRSSRPPSSCSTSATSTRPSSRACSSWRSDAVGAVRRSRRTSRSTWERIWQIEPILFDDALIELADESIREVAGVSHRLPSGPLHDAAEVARAGVPTVMLFVQSLRGLSHTPLEDTKPRAPRAVGAGARPARLEDDRARRGRLGGRTDTCGLEGAGTLGRWRRR